MRWTVDWELKLFLPSLNSPRGTPQISRDLFPRCKKVFHSAHSTPGPYKLARSEWCQEKQTGGHGSYDNRFDGEKQKEFSPSSSRYVSLCLPHPQLLR